MYYYTVTFMFLTVHTRVHAYTNYYSLGRKSVGAVFTVVNYTTTRGGESII